MSYKQILKSTFIMGGSSIFNTFLGILRTKIIAVILGPSGVGLAGIYANISNMSSTFSGMGINESGVRQIAGACGTDDQTTIARTIVTVRRVAMLTGAAGLCFLAFFSGNVSQITFGSAEHSKDIALLAFTIFFGAVSSGQTALIQGMRRIADLAKVSMIGAVLGTFLSIPIIYFFGQKGIIYVFLSISATGILTSWWYSRQITVAAVPVSWMDSFHQAKPLLQLGVVLMLGSVMTIGTQYLMKVFIVRHFGLSAAGVYQASTTLSMVYASFILNAMITDFYPRLSAVSQNNTECASLINKQVEVGLLLAVPGILAIMTFAPLVIAAFYSARFMLAVDILKWQILGVMIQVATWPMGFILRAKGNGKLFFWTELFANFTHLSFAWLGITIFGLAGTGMAFLGMNVLYFVLIFWIVHTQYKFAFSLVNVRLLAIFGLAIGIVFLTPQFMSKNMSLVVNAGITLIFALYSVRTLIGISGIQYLYGPLLKIKARFIL